MKIKKKKGKRQMTKRKKYVQFIIQTSATLPNILSILRNWKGNTYKPRIKQTNFTEMEVQTAHKHIESA